MVDDADRLRTSSLPLGIRPIFTGGHSVYGAPKPNPNPLLPAGQDANAYLGLSQAAAGSTNPVLLYLLVCACDSVSVCDFHPGLAALHHAGLLWG